MTSCGQYEGPLPQSSLADISAPQLQTVHPGDRVLAQAVYTSEASIFLRVLCVDNGLCLDNTYGVIRYKDAGIIPGIPLHTVATAGVYVVCEVLTVSTPCILRPWPEGQKASSNLTQQ